MNTSPQDILNAYRDDLPLSEPQLDGILDVLSKDLEARIRFDRERNFDLEIGAALACVRVPHNLQNTILRRIESNDSHDKHSSDASRHLP